MADFEVVPPKYFYIAYQWKMFTSTRDSLTLILDVPLLNNPHRPTSLKDSYFPFDHLNPATNGATRFIASKPATRTHLDMDCNHISTYDYILANNHRQHYIHTGVTGEDEPAR
jgi:hypothetical protein